MPHDTDTDAPARDCRISGNAAPATFLPDGPHHQVAEVFRRLSHLHAELGEAALGRAVRAVVGVLGACAQEEAERRALALAERVAPRTTDVRVTPFAQRRRPDDVDVDVAD